MRIRGIQIEDFVNYKQPSMFIATCFCDWKCCKSHPEICQNAALAQAPVIHFSKQQFLYLYRNNDITSALVFGGLEPILQFEEVLEIIDHFRTHDEHCPIIIYSGYEEEEIAQEIQYLSAYDNTILKVGRYIPNRKTRYDPILGVTLSSDNQYAIEVGEKR